MEIKVPWAILHYLYCSWVWGRCFSFHKSTDSCQLSLSYVRIPRMRTTPLRNPTASLMMRFNSFIIQLSFLEACVFFIYMYIVMFKTNGHECLHYSNLFVIHGVLLAVKVHISEVSTIFLNSLGDPANPWHLVRYGFSWQSTEWLNRTVDWF